MHGRRFHLGLSEANTIELAPYNVGTALSHEDGGVEFDLDANGSTDRHVLGRVTHTSGTILSMFVLGRRCCSS